MTAAAIVNVEQLPEAQRPIIELTDVKVHFPVKRGTIIRREVGVVRAVDGVSLRVERGTTVALVGESGSGKTTLGRAIMGMVPVTDGVVKVDGRDATATRRGQLPHIVQIVLQDPFGSLDPRMRIERVISEPLHVGGAGDRPAMDPHERVTELLELVGLPATSRNKYPHQFSGGQRQRIAIARALAPNPHAVVLDEPTSALDVSVQAQILNLLQDLQRELGHAYVLISHNLVTVAHVADMVAVMYLGRIVEVGTPDQIFRNPQHPYTRALLESIPSSANLPPVETLRDAPSPMDEFVACRYRSQCRLHRSLGRPAECVERDPVLRQIEGEHMAACHFPGTESETTDSGQIE